MTEHLGVVVPFLYSSEQPIRTVTDDHGEPWFVLADLCAVLDINAPATVIRRLDDDEYKTASVQTERLGRREVTVVSEAGVYEVIMRSNRPEAKLLRRFVTHEVLPAIRKTGRYLTPEAVEEVQELRRNLQHRAEIIRTDLANGRTRGALSTLDAMLYEVDNEYLACLVTASRTQL